jgi:hypothetical protein
MMSEEETTPPPEPPPPDPALENTQTRGEKPVITRPDVRTTSDRLRRG